MFDTPENFVGRATKLPKEVDKAIVQSLLDNGSYRQLIKDEVLFGSVLSSRRKAAKNRRDYLKSHPKSLSCQASLYGLQDMSSIQETPRTIQQAISPLSSPILQRKLNMAEDSFFFEIRAFIYFDPQYNIYPLTMTKSDVRLKGGIVTRIRFKYAAYVNDIPDTSMRIGHDGSYVLFTTTVVPVHSRDPKYTKIQLKVGAELSAHEHQYDKNLLTAYLEQFQRAAVAKTKTVRLDLPDEIRVVNKHFNDAIKITGKKHKKEKVIAPPDAYYLRKYVHQRDKEVPKTISAYAKEVYTDIWFDVAVDRERRLVANDEEVDDLSEMMKRSFLIGQNLLEDSEDGDSDDESEDEGGQYD